MTTRPTTFVPTRDLELATYLSRMHDRVSYHLSASDCETMTLADLLALADAEDRARWADLRLGYTDPIGASWLRNAIAAGYSAIAAPDIVCFAGAQEALYAAVHALLEAGDHAIVVVPSYQSIETLTLGLCHVTGVALDPADGWSLDIAAVARAVRPNTRAILIGFPNNPTGKQLEHDRFAALITLCRQHGIWLLSDEVYRMAEHDPRDRLSPAAEAYERGISLGVLSKAYGMPGLRVGWIACRDADQLSRIAKVRQYLSTCNAGPSEVLACIALKAAPEILARTHAIAQTNLALLMPFLARHPELFDCQAPRGGVVCYPRYLGVEGVERFTARTAETSGVLLLPASVFRSELAELPADHFRIGFGHLSFRAGLAAFEDGLT